MKKTIYILQLEHDKYYVGIAKNSEKRILQHFENNGSAWTKLHKPVRILNQFVGDEFDEEKYTLQAMDKYGVDNVRGGSYCQVKLSDYDKSKSLQTILSITNKCYKCGEKGHYAKECQDGVCMACNGSGFSYWSDDCYGPCMNCDAGKAPFLMVNKNTSLYEFKNIVEKNSHLLPSDFTSKVLTSIIKT